MGDIEVKAKKQAVNHLTKFMDDCTWTEMLEKYAELSNKSQRASEELSEREERGARIEESDFADYHYYQFYCDSLARLIAGRILRADGYNKDKYGYWILKNQPVAPPPKKKRGFWK